jgi:hypothetical protein
MVFQHLYLIIRGIGWQMKGVGVMATVMIEGRSDGLAPLVFAVSNHSYFLGRGLKDTTC